MTRHKVLGICFVEAGSSQQGWPDIVRATFQARIQETFREAGTTEHGDPKFFWEKKEEFVAVFRAEVTVKQRSLLKNLYRPQTWRCALRSSTSR